MPGASVAASADAPRTIRHSALDEKLWHQRWKPAVWTLVSFFCTTYATFIIAYVVSWFTDNLKYPHLYVSAAIDHSPAQNIGTPTYKICHNA